MSKSTIALLILCSILLLPISGVSSIENAKLKANREIEKIIAPLLTKYCADQCKILSIDPSVEFVIPEEIAPGFDEISQANSSKLSATSATVHLLMDSMIGPVSREKLLSLLQEHLSGLKYPVRIEPRITQFPQPASAAAKVAELRKRLESQFREVVEGIFQKFCPEQCLLADLSIRSDQVNPEEAQYGSTGEFIQDGDIAIKIRNISAVILMDNIMTPEERANIVEMARLKTNFLSNVNLTGKAMTFPDPYGSGKNSRIRGLASVLNSKDAQSKSSSESKNESLKNTNASEVYQRMEKIDRVEKGDILHKEFERLKWYGFAFALCLFALFGLLFYYLSKTKFKKSDSEDSQLKPTSAASPSKKEKLSLQLQIDDLTDELMKIFAEQPRVAKHVFSRVLSEEGVETTAKYIDIFGESVVLDILRDPSMQNDVQNLMEYYAKNVIELNNEDKLSLLKALQHRTTAGKMVVYGSRSSSVFDFLAEMDAQQIYELIQNESITVKAIVLTQVSQQKRVKIAAYLDGQTKMKLYTELTRIDYLPRDFIYNVANALKRKRIDNPKLNTEPLPGSEVLVNLLESTNQEMQRNIIQNLEQNNPESARTIKSKLISLDTLLFLRDNQLLELVLSLKHDELLQFLKNCPDEIRKTIFSKSPKDLVLELEEELSSIQENKTDTYSTIERKILNRIKLMANEGLINLVETNERMFDIPRPEVGFVEAGPGEETSKRKGWW